jgi:hypothetical protein
MSNERMTIFLTVRLAIVLAAIRYLHINSSN